MCGLGEVFLVNAILKKTWIESTPSPIKTKVKDYGSVFILKAGNQIIGKRFLLLGNTKKRKKKQL